MDSQELEKNEDGATVEYLAYMIQNAVDAFEIESDLRAWDDVVAVEEQIARLRAEPLAQEEASLAQLEAQLRELEEALKRSELDPARSADRQELASIAQHKYELARELNHLEETNTTESLRLKHLRNNVEQLESANPVLQSLSRPDAAMAALKLRLYRSLGLRGDPKAQRVLITSQSRRSVRVAGPGPGKNDCDVADEVWAAM